jgi:hypothetical protein
LAFFFEPNLSQFTLVNSNLSLNKNYMHIIDLQETQSVSVCVEWAHDRAWLRCYDTGTGNTYGSAAVPSTSTQLYSNGYISVAPFTGLANNDDSTVEVNVYIRGRNMHFNQVSGEGIPTDRMITESEDMNDVETMCFPINPTSANDAHISEHHFGEEVFSLRSILKRFVTTDLYTIGSAVSLYTIQTEAPILPLPNPVYGSTASAYKTILGSVQLAYVGMRGSMRFRVVSTNGDIDYTKGARVLVSLQNPEFNAPVSSISWTSAVVNAVPQIGGVAFVPGTNGGIEFDIPYYSNNLFAFAFTTNYVGTNPDNMVYDAYFTKNFIVHREGDPTQTRSDVTIDRAIGEDFMFYQFSGAPFFRV